MSQGRRYKFQGSTFAVQTGFGTGKNVTAITLADPAVVSAAAHGFVLGTVVQLNDIFSPTQLDGGVYAVDNPTTGTFELAGVDSTGYDAFATESPSNAQAVPITFSQFCELTGMNQQGGTADQIDATTICSTVKEFEQGLSDSGTLQLDYNFAPLENVQTAIRAAEISGDQLAFKVTLPNSGGIIIVIGSVTTSSFTAATSGLWKGSASIKLSGEIFVVDPT